MRQSERWVEVARELTRFDALGGFDFRPFLNEVRELLGAQNTLIYNPTCTEQGWDLEFGLWTGEAASARSAAHREHVKKSLTDKPHFAAYDPFAVQRAQRNRALTVQHLLAIESGASEAHRRVWSAIGAGQQDQVRILLCHGPRLLAWFGAVRDRRFGRADEQRLQSLASAMRARLVAERAARARAPHLGLVDGLLAAITEPALLLTKHGRIEAANAAGLQLVDEDRAELFQALREALALGKRHPSFALTRLAAPGCPEYVLALHVDSHIAHADQVGQACRRWQLHGRRATVLEQLVAGRSNKEIAQLLQCAEVTVERHVTSLFRASGAASRTELLSKVLMVARGAGRLP